MASLETLQELVERLDKRAERMEAKVDRLADDIVALRVQQALIRGKTIAYGAVAGLLGSGLVAGLVNVLTQ